MRAFDGDLDDYRKWLNRRNTASRNGTDTSSTGEVPKYRNERKAARKAAADHRAALRPLRNRTKKLMEQIDEQSAKLKEIEEELADPSLYDSDNREWLEDLLRRQGDLR